MEKNPYRHADKEIARLIKVLDAEFNNLALRLPNDELNFPTARKYVSSTYQKILKDVMKSYRKITKAAINDARERCKALGIIEDPDLIPTVDEVTDGTIKGYDRVSGYVFDNEWERKQDRTIEALIALTIMQERRRALKAAENVLKRQVKQYGDTLTDNSMLAVYKANGVKKVRWSAILDSKTCKVCYGLDGNVYPINKAPALPQHYYCRCFLIPIKSEEDSEK